MRTHCAATLIKLHDFLFTNVTRDLNSSLRSRRQHKAPCEAVGERGVRSQTRQSVGHLLRHRFERLHRYWNPPTYHRVRHPTRGNCAAPSALFFRALSARRRVYERAREWLLQNRAGAVRLSASTAARCDMKVSPRRACLTCQQETWRKELCR